MKQYDQVQMEIQNILDKIARANAPIARHESHDIPDKLALIQYGEMKRQ